MSKTATMTAALAGALLGAGVAAAEPPLALVIENAEATRALRCTALLAHFVTLPETLIGPGASETLSLVRSPDGTLALAGDARRPVLEAVHCGAADAWSKTWSALPLGGARTTTAERVALRCRLAARLVCAPPQKR